MSTKIQNILPTIWKQISTPEIPWAPTMSAAEQTKLTWAKIVESYADVPNVYQSFFEPFLVSGRAFPYAVLTPARDGFTQKTTEKLIYSVEQEIYILERNENSVEAQCYPIDGISYVEFNSVLLASHIKISGVTKQGISTSCTIKFNSVGEHLFTPILKKIRLGAVALKDTAQSLGLEKFDHLNRLNFKFMNYAKRSLLMGDKVIHSILQSEIRAPVVKFLGMTYYRKISPTHMSILTNRELIMIRENELEGGAGKYGGTWEYIPLNKILSPTLSAKENGLLVLSIQLPENIRFEYLFQASMKQELDQLLGQLREMIA